jgi:hypothetical protein
MYEVNPMSGGEDACTLTADCFGGNKCPVAVKDDGPHVNSVNDEGK